MTTIVAPVKRINIQGDIATAGADLLDLPATAAAPTIDGQAIETAYRHTPGPTSLTNTLAPGTARPNER